MIARQGMSLLLGLTLMSCDTGASTPLGGRECEAAAGSPIDLGSEPSDWLRYGRYLRWTDDEGCRVRIDVISHHRGASHCGWESMEWITIGDPLGPSIAGDMPGSRRYVWDPDGVLPDGPVSNEIDAASMPSSAADTGYRRGGAELWIDESDESTLYRVLGDTVEVWQASSTGVCA